MNERKRAHADDTEDQLQFMAIERHVRKQIARAVMDLERISEIGIAISPQHVRVISQLPASEYLQSVLLPQVTMQQRRT